MRNDHLSGHRLASPRPSAPRSLSEILVTKATASRHPEAADQRQEAGLDGWYARSHRPRPWLFRRADGAAFQVEGGRGRRRGNAAGPGVAVDGARGYGGAERRPLRLKPGEPVR
jgi:hypothetical protein